MSCLLYPAKAQQKPLQLRFRLVWHEVPVRTDGSFYHLSANDSLTVDAFSAYISRVQLYRAGKPVFSEADSYHLINTEDQATMEVTLRVPADQEYDAIRFNLGVDSSTNVSGAMGGDLDPVKGMYWTWQSGYINAKLEGKSNLCHTRKNRFQLHLGGYAGATNSLQQITLPVPKTGDVQILIRLDEFLQAVHLDQNSEIMIPGKEAVRATRMLATSFKSETL